MWVTQTYLGKVEPDAKLFVYYLFEDYNDEQREFTEKVETELGKLGEVYGDDVSLLMPNPRYAGRIEGEMRKFDWMWEQFAGNLPGLFISRRPIVTLRLGDESPVYVSLKNGSKEAVAAAIRKVRAIADASIDWNFTNPYEKGETWSERVWDALELKPGFSAAKIDLKKLFRL